MSFQITSRTYNLYLNLGIQYLKVYSEYLSTSLHGQLIFNIVSNQELQIFHFGSKFTLKIGGDLNKISNEASILLLSPQGDIILDYPFDKIGNINQTKTYLPMSKATVGTKSTWGISPPTISSLPASRSRGMGEWTKSNASV